MAQCCSGRARRASAAGCATGSPELGPMPTPSPPPPRRRDTLIGVNLHEHVADAQGGTLVMGNHDLDPVHVRHHRREDGHVAQPESARTSSPPHLLDPDGREWQRSGVSGRRAGGRASDVSGCGELWRLRAWIADPPAGHEVSRNRLTTRTVCRRGRAAGRWPAGGVAGRGSGPVLLAPECNYSWTSSMVELMSGELAGDGHAHGLRPQRAGGRSILGRSLGVGDGSGAGPPRGRALRGVRVLVHRCVRALASRHFRDRVAAVAAGGFPLLGNYGVRPATCGRTGRHWKRLTSVMRAGRS